MGRQTDILFPIETLLSIILKYFFILLNVSSPYVILDNVKNLIDPYLMVLNLPAHHSECVVACMMIYMNSAEPG